MKTVRWPWWRDFWLTR